MSSPVKASVSPWPHAIGFVFASIGFAYLIVRFHVNPVWLTVMIVYGCGLCFAFGASALYHWLGGGGRRRNAVFRRIDHAAIFALIASTYTPVLFFGLDGAWRISMLASVWFLAALGILSTVWFLGAPRIVSTSLYVAMGWVALVPAVKLAAALPHAAGLLFVLGGILYSAGGAIYATRALNVFPGRFGFHEVFHVFVVAAAGVHFVAIAFYLVPA